MPAAAPARLLASPAIRTLIGRRLAEIGGVLLGLAGVALLVALACYNPLDPSFNTATSLPPNNLAGPIGAIAADLLLQSFGLAAVLPSIAMLAWAWRIASHRGLGSFAARLASTIAALPAAASVAAAIPGQWKIPSEAGLGGAIGSVIAHAVTGYAAVLIGPFGWIVALLAGLLASALLIWTSLGLSVRRRVDTRTAQSSGAQSFGAQSTVARRAAKVDRAATKEQRTVPSRLTGLIGLVRRRPQPERQLDEFAPLPPDPRRPASQYDRQYEPGLDAEPGLHPDPVPVRHTEAWPEETRTRLPTRSDQRIASQRIASSRDRDPEPAHDQGDVPSVALPPPPMPAFGHGPGTIPPLPPSPASPLTPPLPRPRISLPMHKPAPRQSSLPLAEAAAGWRTPPLSLLKAAPPRGQVGPSEESLQANARLLESVLDEYGVQGTIRDIKPGPVVTLYELEPAPGIRSARVIGLADDVARSLSVTAVRIATVSGRNVIGIEVPNSKRETVYLSELFSSEAWEKHPAKLTLALGKDIGGEPILADLARMPHLLVAGTTGSGKSVGINAMILSLLYRLSPDQCRLILIDPKMLELSVYDGIPHLMAPVVTEPAKAVTALKWTVREMERRYRAMSQLGVRNVGGYNERVEEAQARGEVVTRRVQTGFDEETGKPIFEEHPLALEKLPFLVVVIDEMADLMMVAGKEIEITVQRLAQMARAAGIHVIMATQRPSVDVITGTIKANFPTRISFTVISKFDSRTILGEQGAEQLLGQGDMLYMQGGGRIGRVHGPFVSDREVEDVVAYLRSQGEPSYLEEVTEAADEEGNPGLRGVAEAGEGEKNLFDQAVAIVAREGKCSTSFIQRHLSIGYNKAAKLVEQMEREGIITAANHVGKREILVRRTNED